MSSADTRALIERAVIRLGEQVPSLKQLKLVIRLELHARADAGLWRVELPGPVVGRDPGADARLNVTVQRADFNQLAEKGSLRDWVKSYERGHVTVSGEPAVVRLIGSVIERQLARSG